jgi:hypothetical protein
MFKTAEKPMEELLIPVYVQAKPGLPKAEEGEKRDEHYEVGDTIRPLALATIDERLKEGFTVRSYQIANAGPAQSTAVAWLVVAHLVKSR